MFRVSTAFVTKKKKKNEGATEKYKQYDGNYILYSKIYSKPL